MKNMPTILKIFEIDGIDRSFSPKKNENRINENVILAFFLYILKFVFIYPYISHINFEASLVITITSPYCL